MQQLKASVLDAELFFDSDCCGRVEPSEVVATVVWPVMTPSLVRAPMPSSDGSRVSSGIRGLASFLSERPKHHRGDPPVPRCDPASFASGRLGTPARLAPADAGAACSAERDPETGFVAPRPQTTTPRATLGHMPERSDGTKVPQKEAISAWAEAARPHLIEVAQNGTTIPYKALANHVRERTGIDTRQ